MFFHRPALSKHLKSRQSQSTKALSLHVTSSESLRHRRVPVHPSCVLLDDGARRVAEGREPEISRCGPTKKHVCANLGQAKARAEPSILRTRELAWRHQWQQSWHVRLDVLSQVLFLDFEDVAAWTVTSRSLMTSCVSAATSVELAATCKRLRC